MVHRDSDVSDRRPSLEGLYGAGQHRPLHSRFPAAYFLAPPALKAWGRKILTIRHRLKSGATAGLIERYLEPIARWPSAGIARPVPVLLTHDVDSGAGFANLPSLLSVEEANGFKSLNHLVTHRYPLDRARIADWVRRGHRFGVHDTLHDNLLPYLPATEIRARMTAALAALGELGVRSFRSPAFLRSQALYEGISGLIEVDFSSNDWALSWPYPGDGIGTPFPVKHGTTLCAPTTLPRDGELISLGLTPEQGLDLWKRKATELARVGAPVILLTHPDPGFIVADERGDGWRAAYAALLAWLRANPQRFREESGVALEGLRSAAQGEI